MQSRIGIWIGRIMMIFVALFLCFDVGIHIMQPPAVVAGFAQLGFPLMVAIPLSIIELICILLYIFPCTSVLGAVLLTGYLGGAVAANVRIGNPLFTNILFPVYIAILLWGGIYLLTPEFRKLFPWKK